MAAGDSFIEGCLKALFEDPFVVALNTFFEEPIGHARRSCVLRLVSKEEAAMLSDDAYDAEVRALKLLLEHLDEDQRLTYKAGHGYFDVQPRGKRSLRMIWERYSKFRVYRFWYNGTVEFFNSAENLELGYRSWHYCIHSKAAYRNVPMPDQLLSMKLLLETDERKFLRIANRISG